MIDLIQRMVRLWLGMVFQIMKAPDEMQPYLLHLECIQIPHITHQHLQQIRISMIEINTEYMLTLTMLNVKIICR